MARLYKNPKSLVRYIYRYEMGSLKTYTGYVNTLITDFFPGLVEKYIIEQPGELLNIPQRTKEYPQFEHLKRNN